jgi:hypothetical protein
MAEHSFETNEGLVIVFETVKPCTGYREEGVPMEPDEHGGIEIISVEDLYGNCPDVADDIIIDECEKYLKEKEYGKI